MEFKPYTIAYSEGLPWWLYCFFLQLAGYEPHGQIMITFAYFSKTCMHRSEMSERDLTVTNLSVLIFRYSGSRDMIIKWDCEPLQIVR